MSYGQVLTPGVFEQTVRDMLLIRGALRSIPSRVTPSIELNLEVFNVEGDEHGNIIWSQVSYADRWCLQGKRDDYNPLVGLDLNYLPNDNSERHTHLEQLITMWRKQNPPWAGAAAVVIYIYGEDHQVVMPGSFQMMQHFARLETRLAYEMLRPDPTKNINPWVLGGIFYRISALLKNYNNTFQQVVGGVDLNNPKAW